MERQKVACNRIFTSFFDVTVKMFTKVTCKKNDILCHIEPSVACKLDLAEREKGKTFISFVGKMIDIFSIELFLRKG